jgi:16S rRNA G966 N2-methylase RsmD
MSKLFQGPITESGPVECLGQTFPSEEARREHYLKLLAEKLKDPEFRKIEGFPKGTDDAILAMSDPPYYTACPNPFLSEFVKQHGKPYDARVKYSREPMAIDVSVGKTDPLYKAHSYHTKVPHLAIVPSILHYTEPGDVVLDGFAGSGMTGVAAQWCENPPASFRLRLETDRKKEGKPAPKWGARRVVLNDLSPAASFIAANYNLPFDVEAFSEAGKRLLKEVELELGWMYVTTHSDGKTKGQIEFTVWSQMFSCPECAGEVNFTDEALDEDTKGVRESFPCPQCGSVLTKKALERRFVSTVDKSNGQIVQVPQRKPVLISYKVSGKRYTKAPDDADLALLHRIDGMSLPSDIPTMELPPMHMTHQRARMDAVGITHVHHFYMLRSVHALASLWEKARNNPDCRIREMLMFFVEQATWGISVLARYVPTHFSQVNQYLNGVYYVSSQHAECSPWYLLDGKLGRLAKAFLQFKTVPQMSIINTGTAASLALPDCSIDYVFTDPPFGENIYYSDLNYLVESWHRVITNAETEAIIDRFKTKALPEYQRLMHRCFAEYFRVLKPGRWMTVVFSNSKASVWNAIQVALQQAGFVVAEVTALDKVQGSYRQVTSATAVKQDLVISAYKPNGGLEERFIRNGATEESAWDFVQSHLKYLLPVKPGKAGELEMVVERDPRRIFDRMIAWFVRHNAPVPISSVEFQEGIRQRFDERDGMIFLPEQAVEYDKKRAQVAQAPQMELFVMDERSAIDWLIDFLKKRPSTYQKLHPEFITQLGAGWKKHEAKPELAALLASNFIQYDGTGEVPSQIHAYLSSNHKDLRSLSKDNPLLVAKAKDRWYVPDPNKAQDLEKKREKALLKEFETYQATTGRRLKEFRLEVLRAGFKAAWTAKDYKAIISIAQKVPEEALQEDEKLLLWYDQALTRTEAGA